MAPLFPSGSSCRGLLQAVCCENLPQIEIPKAIAIISQFQRVSDTGITHIDLLLRVSRVCNEGVYSVVFLSGVQVLWQAQGVVDRILFLVDVELRSLLPKASLSAGPIPTFLLFYPLYILQKTFMFYCKVISQKTKPN